MGVLQLLDEATVLFDFHHPTGAANFRKPSRRSSAPHWNSDRSSPTSWRSARPLAARGAANARVVVAPGTKIGRTLALVTEGVDPSQQRQRSEAGAVSELQGIARFKLHEGKVEEYKRLSAQAMIQ
jgi:hypothetical protein